MRNQKDQSQIDDEDSSAGTVASRPATVVNKKPEAASPGANADQEAAEESLNDDNS